MKKKLMILTILFSFIQSQPIWGQNTWVARTKVEQGLIDHLYNKFLLGEGASKVNTGAVTTDYSLTKNPDGISYVLKYMRGAEWVWQGSAHLRSASTSNVHTALLHSITPGPMKVSIPSALFPWLSVFPSLLGLGFLSFFRSLSWPCT